MDKQRFEFETVDSLGAVAQGKPGHRTFYVYAVHRRTWARCWLEKEELALLSDAIDEILNVPEEPEEVEEEPIVHKLAAREPTGKPSVEFKVGRLALAYDEAKDRVGLLAFESAEPDDQEAPTIVFWASREQARDLSRQIQEVVSAGRPVCQLCGGPIDLEGHVCPRMNGHLPIRIE